MKVNLSYQISEYDCGPTCFLNALRCLFARKEVPVEVIKMINDYTLDAANRNGIIGKHGTSDKAVKSLAEKLSNYQSKKFKVCCKVLEKNEVNFENNEMMDCIKNGGVIILKCMIGVPHFILISDIVGDEIYFFDPYYRERAFNDDRIEIVDLEKANRKIKVDAMNAIRKINFSLGEFDNRLALLIDKRV